MQPLDATVLCLAEALASRRSPARLRRGHGGLAPRPEALAARSRTSQLDVDTLRVGPHRACRRLPDPLLGALAAIGCLAEVLVRGLQLGAGLRDIGLLREALDLLRPVMTCLLVDALVRLGVEVAEEVEVVHLLEVLAEHVMGASLRAVASHHLGEDLMRRRVREVGEGVLGELALGLDDESAVLVASAAHRHVELLGGHPLVDERDPDVDGLTLGLVHRQRVGEGDVLADVGSGELDPSAAGHRLDRE